MKKVSVVLVGLLTFFLISTITKAATPQAYELDRVGQYARGNSTKVNGPKISVTNQTPKVNAQLSITVQKPSLFSDKLIGRHNKDILNVNSYVVQWDFGTNNFTTTAIYNQSYDGSNATIKGYYYVENR